jgi:hypothetical protein
MSVTKDVCYFYLCVIRMECFYRVFLLWFRFVFLLFWRLSSTEEQYFIAGTKKEDDILIVPFIQ